MITAALLELLGHHPVRLERSLELRRQHQGVVGRLLERRLLVALVIGAVRRAQRPQRPSVRPHLLLPQSRELPLLLELADSPLQHLQLPVLDLQLQLCSSIERLCSYAEVLQARLGLRPELHLVRKLEPQPQVFTLARVVAKQPAELAERRAAGCGVLLRAGLGVLLRGGLVVTNITKNLPRYRRHCIGCRPQVLLGTCGVQSWPQGHLAARRRRAEGMDVPVLAWSIRLLDLVRV
mmetsp:Transcript_84037/g.216328  ORF Transcript_84037/g.216328 Transcript_84037/m.216328 type:complete len:236 (-) Transcript_84037:109-816(-)